MKTTLNIDDNLLKNAQDLTGIKEKTALINLGLELIIRQENQTRLIKLAGTRKNLKLTPRR